MSRISVILNSHCRREHPAGRDAAEEIQLDGAGSRNRTRDLLITNQLLYQLSYAGTAKIIAECTAPPVRLCREPVRVDSNFEKTSFSIVRQWLKYSRTKKLR